MNLLKYFDGGQDPRQTYLGILKALYPISKKYKKTLVTGGLLLEGDYQLWIDFLTSKEVSKYYDVLSLHPYCYPKPLSKALFSGLRFQKIVLNIRNTWSKNKILGKEIWITEIGWLHSSSIKNQSDNVLSEEQFRDVISDLDALCYRLKIKSYYIYALEDDRHANDVAYKGFGYQLKSGQTK
ncbi:hypothetical protein MJH12_15420 [bacterium]|nr:hypothetical protein [bacterium]